MSRIRLPRIAYNKLTFAGAIIAGITANALHPATMMDTDMVLERGARARAAEILGINLSTVYRKIKRYGLLVS